MPYRLEVFDLNGEPIRVVPASDLPEATAAALRIVSRERGRVVDIHDASGRFLGSAVMQRRSAVLVGLANPSSPSEGRETLSAVACQRAAADFMFRYPFAGRHWTLDCVAGSLPKGWEFPPDVVKDDLLPLTPGHVASALCRLVRRRPEVERYITKKGRRA